MDGICLAQLSHHDYICYVLFEKLVMHENTDNLT